MGIDEAFFWHATAVNNVGRNLFIRVTDVNLLHVMIFSFMSATPQLTS